MNRNQSSSSVTRAYHSSHSSLNLSNDSSPFIQHDLNPPSRHPNSSFLGKTKEQQMEEKRVRRLIRNREAAKRNRLKKKEWIAELQETNSQVRFLNRDLKSRMEKLEKELTQVQGVLVKIGVDRIPQVSEFIAMPSGPTESEMGQYDDEDEEEEEEETEMTEAPMIAPAATRA